jgi:Nucleotidyl transferase AbiEii toxin, Type IV TA system
VSGQPTNATQAGQLYLALQREARAQKRSTDELLQLHALEAFVARLVHSPRARDFVLKGGVLLAAYDVRRPTRDVDLSTHTLSNAPEALKAVVAEVAAYPLGDGWELETLGAAPIREDAVYSGVRVSLRASLARARQEFHVDVSFGDPIVPAASSVTLRRLLGGELVVSAYPLTMVLAEKLLTAVQRGSVNTRWRDYADLYLLSSVWEVDGGELHRALAGVAAARGVELRTLSSATVGFALLAQAKWSAWVRKQGLGDRIPSDFAAVILAVAAFADPALEGSAMHAVWRPQVRQWG